MSRVCWEMAVYYLTLGKGTNVWPRRLKREERLLPMSKLNPLLADTDMADNATKSSLVASRGLMSFLTANLQDRCSQRICHVCFVSRSWPAVWPDHISIRSLTQFYWSQVVVHSLTSQYRKPDLLVNNVFGSLWILKIGQYLAQLVVKTTIWTYKWLLFTSRNIHLTNKVCHGTPKQCYKCKIMYIPNPILVKNQCTVWCIRLWAAF